MVEEYPNFWSVTPAPVRYSTSLSPGAKILYGELSALTKRDGYCYASNNYFMELYQCDRRTIQRWIHELQDEGFIRIEQVKGRERRIHIAFFDHNEYSLMINGGAAKMSRGGGKNVTGGAAKMSPPYNIKEDLINNNINNIINYLNQQTGKNFRKEAESNRRFIRARLNEGYSEDDFKKVIDIKVAKWKGVRFSDGPLGDDYLRPSTLFAPTRFESYLNELDVPGTKALTLSEIRERLRKKLNKNDN